VKTVLDTHASKAVFTLHVRRSCTAHSSHMYVVRVRCFRHAENNVHVWRAGYSEHVRHTERRNGHYIALFL